MLSVINSAGRLNKPYKFSDGLDILYFLIGNLDIEFVLKGHDYINDIKGISSQVIDNAGIKGNAVLINLELEAKYFFDLIKNHF